MRRTLIAYATKHGSTKEIAEKIAERLSDRLEPVGIKVDVRPVGEVDRLDQYQAVIIGSAVYAGHWRKEAAEFLQRHEPELIDRYVWFFSSGPTGEGDPSTLMEGWRFPEKLDPLAKRIQPKDIAFFHGQLDPKRLGLGERLIAKAVKAPLGDYRDWKRIQQWADQIASVLLNEYESSL